MNADDQNRQNDQREQNDLYRSYIPSEIPIPAAKGRKQGNPYQDRNPELSQGQNGLYWTENAGVPYGSPMQPYGQRKKDGTAKLLILAACMGALIFAIAAGIVYFRSTPSYKISRGFRNLEKEIGQSRDPLAEKTGMEDLLLMMTEEGFHIDSRINFTSEILPAGVNTIGIDTDGSRDVEKQEMSAHTSISVMNYEFAHLNFYTDNEAVCFSVPELFLEDMYFENKNVVSQYNESLFAQLTGPVDAQDFSLDFFPEKEEQFSPQDWKNMSGFLERHAADLEACRSGMLLEKAEKGVYRVVLPGAETDHLLQNIWKDSEQAHQADASGRPWKEYDSLISSDIRILFEINGKNRIEAIRLEEPVQLLDGTVSINGWLSFMGDVRSIDEVVGVLMPESGEGKEPLATFQYRQTPAPQQYESELYVGVFDEEDSIIEMKYAVESDAALDQISRRLSVRNAEENMEIFLEGSLDDIVRGESFALDLEKMTFQRNGRELFKLTGDLLIEPLTGEDARTVKKENAFFKMTERDWWDIVRRIEKEYGGLLR